MTEKQTAELITVTPDLARVFLSKSRNVRRLTARTARNYARAMANGQWSLNGDTMKFDAEGYLTDGQHRCAACVEANRAFQTWAIHGSTAENSDENKIRTLAQTQGISSRTMGAVRIHYMWWEMGDVGVAVNREIAPVDLENHCVRHPDFEARMRSVASWAMGGFNPAILGALSYEIADEDGFGEFIDVLRGHAGCSHRHPVRQLRDRMLSWRYGTGYDQKRSLLGLAVKAWNYMQTGREVSSLRFSDESPLPDPVLLRTDAVRR